MRADTITVYDRNSGLALTLFAVVADLLGLKRGDRLSPREFSAALQANCHYGIAYCDSEIDPESIN